MRGNLVPSAPRLATSHRPSWHVRLVFGVVVSLMAPVLAFAVPEFATRRMLAVGKNPGTMAAADFDQDGSIDIAVTQQGASSTGLSILFGRGGGRFAAAVPIAAARMLGVVAADLNEDGHVDLALTGLGPSQLVVLIGDGAGHFSPGASLGSTTRSGSLAAADFNLDGHTDLVISNATAGTVSIYSGDGAGGFSGPLDLSVGASAGAVVAGNLDLDGLPDVAVTVGGGAVAFLKGNGAGGFAAPTTTTIGTSAAGLAAGEVTGDGIPDLVVANSATGAVFVLVGQGNGTFVAQQVATATAEVTSVAIGDLDGDGRPDLLAGSTGDSIHLFAGTGPGTWGPDTPYYSGGAPVGLLARDLTGDGRPDVAASNLLSNDVALLPGDVMGGLIDAARIPMALRESADLKAADFNGDGQTDLAVLNSYGPVITECLGPPGPIDCGDQMTVAVAPGDGMGRFGAPILTQTHCAPVALAAADFNQDGRTDVIIAHQGARDAFGICFNASLGFFPGNGAGGFGAPSDVVVPDEPVDVAAGDFNEDGRMDVVVTYGVARLVRLYRVSTNGALVAAAGVVLGSDVGHLAVADLNGDGHLDVAVAEPLLNRVAILLGNGGGLLTLDAQCDTLGTGLDGIAIGDLDGDGRPEIAAANYGTPTSPTSTIAIIHQDADHVFCLPGSTELMPMGSSRASRIVAVDLDADGASDLAATDTGASFMVVPATSGGFGPADRYGVFYAESIVAADFDGNGLPDIAVCTAGWYGDVSVVLNTTPAASRMILQVDSDRVAWVGVAGAVSYDLVRGSLAVLGATHGDFAAATEACMDDDLGATSYDWPDVPPPGTLWWVLARPVTPAGPGTYDSGSPGQVGSRDPGIAASGLACP